jgi:hypothetical protein
MDDHNAPSTKGDLADLETRLTEAIRDSQTEVLRAIYGYTETIQTHLKDLDRSETGIRERMTVLESRVLELERRLNLPN